MSRVMAQGDLRPMAASREAMEDLKTILAGRAAFYSKAELRVDTSAQPLAETFQILRLRCGKRWACRSIHDGAPKQNAGALPTCTARAHEINRETFEP